jgi:hypothetical protein
MRITNDDELHSALVRLEYLMEELDELSKSIEEYEDIHYPIEKPNMLERFKFHMLRILRR